MPLKFSGGQLTNRAPGHVGWRRQYVEQVNAHIGNLGVLPDLRNDRTVDIGRGRLYTRKEVDPTGAAFRWIAQEDFPEKSWDTGNCCRAMLRQGRIRLVWQAILEIDLNDSFCHDKLLCINSIERRGLRAYCPRGLFKPTVVDNAGVRLVHGASTSSPIAAVGKSRVSHKAAATPHC